MIVGQDEAIEQIVNIYQMNLTGMSAPGRPIGNFLFLGPTGSGKTRIVEATAEALLKNPRAVIKIDCAEFQHSHEIAKLIGSPPGYLGHRETHPLLSQEVLNQYHTETMKLSFVLFDEIEKASRCAVEPAARHSRQSYADAGRQSQGGFSRAMIFMTSNLGAAEMSNVISPKLGFGVQEARDSMRPERWTKRLTGKLARSGVEAARRKFTPEFMNRLDKIVTFQPLGTEQLRKILDIELNLVQQRIFNTSNDRAFVFTSVRFEQGILARRRHRSEVRRTALEARHRAAAGAAYVEPDRYRPGPRRRLDPRGFRQRKPELTFTREAEGLPVTDMADWWIGAISATSSAMAAGCSIEPVRTASASRLEKAREARSQAIGAARAAPFLFSYAAHSPRPSFSRECFSSPQSRYISGQVSAGLTRSAVTLRKVSTLWRSTYSRNASPCCRFA